MKYILHNNQMVLLAGLLDQDKVIGLENTFVEDTLEEVMEKWRQYEPDLLTKKIIFYNEEHKLQLDGGFRTVLDILFNPDFIYMIGDAVEEKAITYFYIKGNQCTYMHNEGMCILEAFEKMDDFITRLIEQLEIKPYYYLMPNLQKVSVHALGKILIYEGGKLIHAIKFREGMEEIHMSMRVYSNEATNCLVKYRLDTMADEVSIYKGSAMGLIQELFYF